MIGKAIKIKDEEWLVIGKRETSYICFNGEKEAHINIDFPYEEIPLNDYFKTFAELDFRKKNYDTSLITMYVAYNIEATPKHIQLKFSVR